MVRVILYLFFILTSQRISIFPWILGIQQWMINLYKITTFVDLNHWLKCLGTAGFEPTNSNLIKVPKVFEPKNKITWL